jgi:hypothetical protein
MNGMAVNGTQEAPPPEKKGAQYTMAKMTLKKGSHNFDIK